MTGRRPLRTPALIRALFAQLPNIQRAAPAPAPQPQQPQWAPAAAGAAGGGGLGGAEGGAAAAAAAAADNQRPPLEGEPLAAQ
jgi:Derlin-2/3